MLLTNILVALLLSISCQSVYAVGLCEKQLDAFLAGVVQHEPWAVISNVFHFVY